MSAYLDGELEASQIRSLEQHLESCAPCRGHVDGFRSVDQMLALSIPDFQEDPDGERLLARLNQAIDALPPEEARPADVRASRPADVRASRPVSRAASSAVSVRVPWWKPLMAVGFGLAGFVVLALIPTGLIPAGSVPADLNPNDQRDKMASGSPASGSPGSSGREAVQSAQVPGEVLASAPRTIGVDLESESKAPEVSGNVVGGVASGVPRPGGAIEDLDAQVERLVSEVEHIQSRVETFITASREHAMDATRQLASKEVDPWNSSLSAR